jgi:hypothetical protein
VNNVIKEEKMTKPSNVKTFGQKMRLWIWLTASQIVLFFVFRLRIYSFWSKIYRELYHAKYSDPDSGFYSPLQQELDTVQAQNLMNLVKWTPDGVRELWDAVGSPHWFQHILNMLHEGGKQPSGSVDCDEFAIWAANSVSRTVTPHMLSVCWISENPTKKGLRFKASGHNVCVCRGVRDGKFFYYHIGNWGRSRNFGDVEGVINDVVIRANKDKNHLIGWALWKPDLTLVVTHKSSKSARNLELY